VIGLAPAAMPTGITTTIIKLPSYKQPPPSHSAGITAITAPIHVEIPLVHQDRTADAVAGIIVIIVGGQIAVIGGVAGTAIPTSLQGSGTIGMMMQSQQFYTFLAIIIAAPVLLLGRILVASPAGI
jgi:hypothetical protein